VEKNPISFCLDDRAKSACYERAKVGSPPHFVDISPYELRYHDDWKLHRRFFATIGAFLKTALAAAHANVAQTNGWLGKQESLGYASLAMVCSTRA
jgi:hypothetical protein